MIEAYKIHDINAFTQNTDHSGINVFNKKLNFSTATNKIIPTIKKFSLRNLTNKTCNLTININTAGTIYWAVLESSKSMPSKERLMTGSIGVKQGKENYYMPNLTKNFIINSLTKNTLYTVYVVVKDINGNKSNIVKQEFRTKNMDIEKVNIHTKSYNHKLNVGDKIDIVFNEEVDFNNRKNIKYLMKQWRNLIGIGNTEEIKWFEDNKTLSITLGENCKLKANSTLLILVCISEKSAVYDGKFAKIPTLFQNKNICFMN